MFKKLAGFGLIIAASVFLLAACATPVTQYCRALDEAEPTLSKLAGEPAGLLASRPLMHRLAGKAPHDLLAEWTTFIGALDQFGRDLTVAGIDPATYQGKADLMELPADQQELVVAAADQLTAPDVIAAAEGITQHAADVCQVQFGLS